MTVPSPVNGNKKCQVFLFNQLCIKIVSCQNDSSFISKAMSTNSKNNGLTARRWTIKNFMTFASSMRRGSNRAARLAILAVVFFTSCDKISEAQTKQDNNKNIAVKADSLNKPKVNIKVNRHFDDKGNLVGFDSTYSSFYSNVSGDTKKMDSLINGFDKYFFRDHASMWNRHFNDLFLTDSLRYPDFFHRDFFEKRYELNDAYMKDMMQRMDSVKNQFFYEHSRKQKDTKTL